MKIKPYCSAAMLSAMTDIRRGIACPAPLLWPLRSRGWVDKWGKLTTAGINYVNIRTQLTEESTQ